MSKALVPDRRQGTLFDDRAETLPVPTFEALHPEISEPELQFAKTVEGERKNLRKAVVTLATNPQFSAQHAIAEDVLDQFDKLKGGKLGEAVEDLHLPFEAFGGVRNRRLIALGKTHRAQEVFREKAGLQFQKAPEHIGRTLRDAMRNVRELMRNPASQKQWAYMHAGHRALND